MAIAQSRVINLINSNMDFRGGLIKLVDEIQSHASRVAAGTMTPKAALDYIALIANPQTLLTNYAFSQSILDMEHRHFYTNARRNERRALIATYKRRAEGKRERQVYNRDTPIPIDNSIPTLPQPIRDAIPETRAPNLVPPLSTNTTEHEEIEQQIEERERHDREQAEWMDRLFGSNRKPLDLPRPDDPVSEN